MSSQLLAGEVVTTLSPPLAETPPPGPIVVAALSLEVSFQFRDLGLENLLAMPNEQLLDVVRLIWNQGVSTGPLGATIWNQGVSTGPLGATAGTVAP